MTRRTGQLILLSALICVIALAIFRPPAGVYPSLEISVPDTTTPILITAVFTQQPSTAACEALTGNIVRTTLDKCPTCQIRRSRCDPKISQVGARLLGSEPYPLPTARIRNGILAFASIDSNAAQDACEAASAQAANSTNELICVRPNSPRPIPEIRAPLSLSHLLIPTAAALFAWLAGWLILRYEHLHAHLTHDTTDSGPQKIHSRPTPRIGGLLLVAGILSAWMFLVATDTTHDDRTIGVVLLCSLPALLGGFLEDVTRKVGVPERLLMTMLSGALACWLLGAVVDRIEVPLVDPYLAALPIAIGFTVIAVAGIANSINIIDGFHGLASGLAIIAAATLSYVAWSVGDNTLLMLTLSLLGSLAGFFVWNWPRGLIFLGDGGAYLIGTLLSLISILLVTRHPTVSPWLPLVVLCHPFTETLSSIIRRLFNPKSVIGHPDTDHLHHRLFKHLYGYAPNSSAQNHNLAKFFWLTSALTATIAATRPNSQGQLAATLLLYVTLFIISYRWTRPSDRSKKN
jgi:UDP-GlcNAc:undecaprenyl-phosphate GlcNAc-1-phosphate transferase